MGNKWITLPLARLPEPRSLVWTWNYLWTRVRCRLIRFSFYNSLSSSSFGHLSFLKLTYFVLEISSWSSSCGCDDYGSWNLGCDQLALFLTTYHWCSSVCGLCVNGKFWFIIAIFHYNHFYNYFKLFCSMIYTNLQIYTYILLLTQTLGYKYKSICSSLLVCMWLHFWK